MEARCVLYASVFEVYAPRPCHPWQSLLSGILSFRAGGYLLDVVQWRQRRPHFVRFGAVWRQLRRLPQLWQASAKCIVDDGSEWLAGPLCNGTSQVCHIVVQRKGRPHEESMASMNDALRHHLVAGSGECGQQAGQPLERVVMSAPTAWSCCARALYRHLM